MNPCTSRSAFAAGCLLWLAIQTCYAGCVRGDEPSTPAAAEADGLIPHDDGPLAAHHFVGTVPERLPMRDGITLHAMTETELRFVFRYDGRIEEQGFVATLAEFRTFAVFVGRKSWAASSISTGLLDHEQGHFDITETTARQAQLHFDKLLASEPLIARGMDETSARAALRKQILKQLAPYYELSRREHVRYDQTTRHGTRSREQQKFRQEQLQQLKELPVTRPALDGELPDASIRK